MKILVVSAHPEPKSFNTAMRDEGIATLREAGHEVVLSDLYAMDFDPVARASDFQERSDGNYLNYALEQRRNMENGTLSPDIKDELEKVLECDMLLLNFPVFWFSVPAIMKGWIDRVFVSGKMYGGRRFYDRGGLRGKKALVAVTIGSRQHMFGEDAIHGPFGEMFRHLLQGTLHYVGFDVLPPYIAWHVPYISHEERGDILRSYRRYLQSIDQLRPIEFPSLNDFDELLRPVQPTPVAIMETPAD
ncbi:MAG: NAD(P)H-dependent oxidoreductase [Hyphomicrobiaceae bacterium]|nr:NAD(P)H-dependent oxidoreductase [Hyphomicrobiaceae bacterium]